MEEQNIQIIEKEEEGVSLGRFFKVVFHKWKLFLIVCLGVTLIGSLAFIFIYNNLATTYSSSFTFESLSVQGDENIKEFSIEDFSTKETLEYIKSLKEEYKNIDIDKIIKDKAFEISKNTEDSNSQADIVTTTSSYYDKDGRSQNITFTRRIYRYTLNVKGKYFKNDDDIGSSFIKDLAEYPSIYKQNLIENVILGNDNKIFTEAKDLDHKVSYLTEQFKYIYNSYQTISGYNNQTANLSSFIATFGQSFDTDLKERFSNGGFAKSSDVDSYKKELNQKLSDYKNEFKNNSDKISSYQQQLTDVGAAANLGGLGSEVTTLTKRNGELAVEYIAIGKRLASLNNAPGTTVTINKIDSGTVGFDVPTETSLNEFTNSLDKYYDDMVLSTKVLREVKKNNVDNNFHLEFLNSDVIKVEKRINTVLCILISLLIGFVIAIIVNAIVDRKYFHNPFPSEEKTINNNEISSRTTNDGVKEEKVSSQNIDEVEKDVTPKEKKSKK